MKVLYDSFLNSGIKKMGKLSGSGATKLFIVSVLCFGLQAYGQQNSSTINPPDKKLQSNQVSVIAGNATTPWVSTNTAPAHSANFEDQRNGKRHSSTGTVRKSNFTFFSDTHVNTNAEVAEYNKGYENDPELGVLYASVPCTNCYEILEKRTATQKYFVQEGTQATKFILQSSSGPVHYKDHTGRWRTIGEHLTPVNAQPGVYATNNRETDASINIQKGCATLSRQWGKLTYNNNLELIYIKPDGTELSLGLADWSKNTAGDDGVHITNAWAGIDMEIGVLKNGIKTNFIINSALPGYADGKLVIRDHIIADNGMAIDEPINQAYSGTVSIKSNGNELFVMQKAIAFEQNNSQKTIKNLDYKIGYNNSLDIEIPGSLLNKTAASYPLIIDPMVTSSVAVSGFSYDYYLPTGGSPGLDCITTNNVTIPAAATFTDIQVSYTFYGGTGIPWTYAGYDLFIGATCGTTFLSCTSGSGSGLSGGTCGSINESEWGATTAGYWSTCVPAFSCTSYTLDFEIVTAQDWGTDAACGTAYFASATNFIVNVFGTTAIPTAISPAGPGTLCMPSTLSLTGIPAGGTWGSSGTASVTTGGVVSGTSSGAAAITYTAGSCSAVYALTVGTTPTITGTTSICYTGSPADTVDLTGTPSGGTWTSGTTSVGTVTTTDPARVTAVGTGTTLITYNTGTCSATIPVNVTAGTAVAPLSQPSVLTFSGTSAAGTAVNFTTVTADGYLVIASTSPTLSATPVNNTVYTAGSAFGGGTVIVSSSSGSAPSYTISSLTSNTKYYVFVFSFNNNCSGPQYDVIAPLTGNFSTCVLPPTALTVGTIGVNTIALSWTASPAGGGHISPINYVVHAYTDAAMTTLAAGYPVSVGSVTSYTAGGLLTSTQYYFTVNAVDSCATPSNEVTATTSCTGTTATIPYIQTFDISPTISYLFPDCMGSSAANCIAAGVQNSVTYPGFGSITADHTTSSSAGYFYNFAPYGYCGVNQRYQWLLTPGLVMTAGTTYKLSFWYKVTSGSGVWNGIKAQWSADGTVPTTSTMTSAISTPAFASSCTGGWNQLTGTMTPTSSGVYYVGICAVQTTTADTHFIGVDDIEVCAIPTITASNGTAPYCAPATIDLTATTSNVTDYTWTGPGGFTSTLSNPITVNTTTGTVVYTITGVNDPTTIYGMGGYCSATTTTSLTIHATPAAITGSAGICISTPVTLGETSAGGTWSATPTTVATVSTTGVVTGTGSAGGTATISYTTTGPCSATFPVTVSPGIPTLTITANPIPARCPGINSTVTYVATNTPTSYSLTWTTSPPGLPNVASGTPLPPSPVTVVDLSTVSVGTYTGIFAVTNACGTTSATLTFNILSAPPVISGSLNVCVGATSVLSDASPGGIWSSVSTGIATINASTGLLDGISSGTTTISYSLGVGCSRTAIATVNVSPTSITGPTTICLGTSGTLNDLTVGGTWTSSNTLVATVTDIGSGSVVVTSVGGGIDTITYATGGCTATYVITVTPTPIIGIDSMCVGATVTLTDATPGGTWSSVSGGIATITSGGVVMGISSGTSVISYTIGTCAETVVVTVDPTPTAITGPDSICLGSTVTLTETVTGGVWTSVTTTVATVVAPGYVTGVGIGTSVISYAINACSTSVTVTVNNAPAAIAGTLSLCQYTTVSLTDATGGGTWRSVTPAIATVTGGAVYGAGAGTDTISYTIGGCAATVVVTVNLAPTAISGALTVCRFDSTLLSDPVATGTWHSVTTTVATVDAAGEVTGVTAGTDTISYTIGTCTTTVVVTVNNGPAGITGTDYVCQYANTTLSDIVSSGTWTSVTTSIATVNTTGVVTGLLAGTDTISYTVGACSAYVVVTVNTMPAALTGTFNVCVGSVTTLSESVPGTSWRSGTPSVATVDASGDVTGMSAGTSTITDSIGNCKVTAVVTVNGIPTAIAGDVLMCVGGSAITLTDAVPGGTWSGGATGIATINPSPGYVTPLGGGTTDVTYTTVCGSVTATITVHATPATITGTNNICVGNTITLTESVSLGTWSSSATGVATVDISGDVYGASQGIANISYSTGCGSPAVFPVTVNSAPVAITGTLTVCVGSVTILSDASTGGTWTSGTTSVATVNPTNGHVGGISYGTSVITYSNGCGADVYATVTVNATPTAITGTTNVCVGSTTSLTETVPGGIWSSSATGIATVDVSGDVYGVSQGLVTITYATGCGAPVTHAMTVNAAPVAITGTLTVCVGSVTILSDASTGGTWTSGTTSVATVNPANGHVTGISNGTSEITYSNGCGADVYAAVTVNTTPAAITGTTNVCVGNTIVLSETIPYGTWTSSATSIATVDVSGDVTGIAQGLVIITYSTGCGSAATHAMTVNATPVAITGTFYVCTGSITILSETSTGGTWTSGTTSVATVNPANGHVGGISNGTSVITYSNGCGSDVYATVTVNAAAGPITGAALLCTGSTLTLVDTVLDGTWSISGSAATIGSSTGVVTGISCGTSFVTYTTGCGTPATVSITISAAPVAGSITGNVPICTGSTLTLSDLTSCTGSWSGGTVGIATTSGSTTSTSVGIVSGPGHGTVTITYSTGCGSPITAIVTVNAAPGPITGLHSICTGSCDTVSDTSFSITWSSSATAIVTIDPISGVYCGISQGTATITASNGCSPAATYAVTVHATPAAITGLAVACVGFHTTLSNTATGGTWSSADTTIARVDSLSGIITGEHQGTVVITYSNGCGSPATVTVTINAVPGPITGVQHVCVGNCATLSDTSTGILWTSGAPSILTVNPATGVYCGIAQGITFITASNGCVPGTTITVTVNAAPGIITGTLTTCVGSTTGLANTSTGGIWTSGNTLIATVDSMTGVVTGVDTGTVGITYNNGCGAVATAVVTVHTTAGPISGNHAICAGATLTLSDSVSGGVWGGGTAGIATTLGTTTGTTVVILSGPGHGTTNITYFTGCGSPAIVTVTVNGAPVAITGTLSLCAGGATTTLHDSATGGVWSGGSGIANIDSFTGIVTSDSSGGTAIFTYSNGCGAAVTVAVTINPLPVTPTTITGSMTVCIGATASLHDAVAGGTWSSANPGIARVNSFGVDSGASAGIDTIIYTMSNSCGTASVFTVITVNPLPVAGTILGPSSVCLGSHGTYTDTVSAAAGGTWSSRFTSIATIDSTTGILSTVAYGVDTIKYTRTSLLGCAPAIAKKVVTIDSFPTAPAPITGGTHVCRAAHVFLSDASAGYTWSSSNNIIATVSTSGVVAGLTAGVDTIYYTHTNGCGSASVMHIDTVRPLPLHPGLITGIRSLCIAGTTTLSDTSVSGTGTYFWRSNATAVATVDPTGVVTGITAGTAVISYADSNSCGTMASSATVTVFPAPFGGIIHPATVICVGAVTILTDSLVTAGTSIWGSSNTSIATVDTFGHVHGIDSGTVVIWHAITNYCGTDTTRDTVIVHNAPHVGHISGPSVMCNEGLHYYTDSIPGGIWNTSNSYLIAIGSDTAAAAGDSTGFGVPSHSGIVVIYYAVSNLCGTATASKFVTINPLPNAGIITGIDSVCAGSTITLTDTASGGVWINRDTLIASIVGGVVTGINAGWDTIYYSVTNVCGTAIDTFYMKVKPLPVAGTILGSSYACIGYADTLYDSIAGGIWSQTNGHLNLIGGIIGGIRDSGISAGIDTIRYTVTTPSCGIATAQLVDTIIAFPTVGPITGPDSVCTGSSITLTDTTLGGVWSVYNADASVTAGVADSSIVTGLLQGYDTVYFINTAACGARAVASHLVKVKPVLDPGVITGPNALCQFTSILLTDTITGGVWSSLKLKSIVTASGKDSAILPGIDTILYTVSNSCGTFADSFAITISPAPFAGGIVNSPPLHDTGICLGSKMKVSDSIAGGIWFVNNINAVLNLSTDSVVGYTPGKDTIFYVYTNSCGSDTTKLDIFYIYPFPYLGSIIFSTVPNALCLGASDTVSATEFGATWSSTNPSVASVVTFGSTFGAITALRPGNDSIIFTLPVHNCISSKVFLMKVLDTPDFVISPVITDNKCFGTNFGKITVTLTPDSIGRNIGPFSYEWSNGVSVIKTTSNTDYINSLVAGSYTVTITEPSTQCLRIDSFKVVQPDPISLNDSIKNDTCKTGNGAIWLAVTGGTRPYTYAWSNLTTDTFLTNLFAATYTITVTDSNNCVLDTGLNVMEGTCFDIVIYDVITPNGDGVNDVWVIKGIDDYPDNEVQVFDKWGDLVYSKSHYLNEWGGIANNGSALPDGTYFYIVKLNAVNASGHSNVKTGSILIKH